MEKNITVIDTQGRTYETTWPKRARGLVKSGRARFVNENTICLTRPPQQAEDNLMFDNNIEEMINAEAAAPQKPQTAPGPDAGPHAPRLDEGYLIQKINQILEDTQYLKDSIAQLENADEAAAHAIGNLVEAREHTNQCIIDLLRHMLDGLKPLPANPKIMQLEALQSFLKASDLEENHKFDILNQAIQRMF